MSHGAIREPSLHEGFVTAVRLGGESVTNTAVAAAETFGGPLFEMDAGYVVGLARSTGVATGYKAIAEFLAGAGIQTAASYATAAILRNAPNAFRIAIMAHSPASERAQVVQIRAKVIARVLPRIEALLPYILNPDVGELAH